MKKAKPYLINTVKTQSGEKRVKYNRNDPGLCFLADLIGTDTESAAGMIAMMTNRKKTVMEGNNVKCTTEQFADQTADR